uniref:Uncharacterized protein n=1 Tax=Bracon brevicornis TaxID=1563983 RepID=A0A6V7J5G3_9HYME
MSKPPNLIDRREHDKNLNSNSNNNDGASTSDQTQRTELDTSQNNEKRRMTSPTENYPTRTAGSDDSNDEDMEEDDDLQKHNSHK